MSARGYSIIRRVNTSPPQRAPLPRLTVNLGEAAEVLGVCENSLRVLIRSGRVPIVRIGNRVVITVAALEAYLAEEEATYRREVRDRQDEARREHRWKAGRSA